VRVALIGDRHQLSAVGRGGVLDLAARWVHPDARVTLDRIHRFTRTTVAPDGARTVVTDAEYTALSLAMRTGKDPARVFDALLARDQIRVRPSDTARLQTLADLAAADVVAGVRALVAADTREEVADLNAAIRDRLVAAGRVDDARATATAGGADRGGGPGHDPSQRRESGGGEP
jgi:exodeoxyribonuclease V alpha subunit